MSTRKPEVLYRAEQDGKVVELRRGQGRLTLAVSSGESHSAISIVDPWDTRVPSTPARPS